MPQVKCEYCGAFIDETAEKCPNCGAVNKNFKRIVSGTPSTIEELKRWYMERKLPSENVTRFFIGKNIHEPKAFGIYKDGSEYVVYKNKADGSRAIRYRGTDETYAVNEIYLKLRSEILNQKSHSLNKGFRNTGRSVSEKSIFFGAVAAFFGIAVTAFLSPSWVFGLMGTVLAVSFIFLRKNIKRFIVIAAVIILVSSVGSIAYLIGYNHAHRHDGYYYGGDQYYYVQGHDVYYYDTDDWYYYDSFDDFTSYYPDYTHVSDEYQYNEYYSDFSDSSYYEDSNWSSDSSDSSYSSDSDYDWDSGSSDWDSGSSDWDSDW